MRSSRIPMLITNTYLGPQWCTIDAESPLDHLLLSFPNELFQKIVTETNLYHEQALLSDKARKSWAPIDEEEIKAFLALLLQWVLSTYLM